MNIGARRYVQAALKTRPDYEPRMAPQRIPKRGGTTAVYADEDEFATKSMSTGDARQGSELRRTDQEQEKESWNERTKKPELHFAEHLDGLFPTLQFPRELARRMLTHGSHPASVNGHNAGLSFVGEFFSPISLPFASLNGCWQSSNTNQTHQQGAEYSNHISYFSLLQAQPSIRNTTWRTSSHGH